MIHNLEFAARLVRLRALLFVALVLGFAGCDSTEPLNPDSSTPTELGVEEAELSEPSFAAGRFAGGIPIGTFGQPLSAFGSHYNGAKMTVSPNGLTKYLAEVKARGGKVVLMLAGPKNHYKDRNGLNFTRWKSRVDRFKGTNFDSYINDGTIIGHLVVDEPNARGSWNGKMVSPAQVDEMARYSKQRWPRMATIVRTEPKYFSSRRPRYLDAAWAQYVTRKGTASNYLRSNVADAQRLGLGLVVGLNISKGGPNHRRLNANEVKSFGSAMLSSSYPCAFISWEYGSYQLAGSMKDAMKTLRNKAQSRSSRSCKGSGKLSGSPPSPPSKDENTGGGGSAGGGGGGGGGGSPSAGGGSSSIKVKVTGRVERKRHHLTVTWSGIRGGSVDLHRTFWRRVVRTPNDGRYQAWVPFRGRASYQFKVCEKGTSRCSKTVRIAFR